MALVLGLTLAGVILARVLAERDASRDSEQRLQVAAAEIRGRIAEATALTESLRRFMVEEGGSGVTNEEFARTASRWLSPADLPTAAWAEQIRPADRAGYERRTGQSIVLPDQRNTVSPPSSSYLPATLVSGFPPMNLRGIDLGRESGIAAALRRAIDPGGVGATPLAVRSDGTSGFFLVAPAPNVIDGALRSGAVVVFVSEATLREAAENPAGLRLASTDASTGSRGGGNTVREEFTVAGQRFAVLLPKESVTGPGAILPWIILATGLALAVLAGAVAVIAARRARAQRDFDRIFNLSPDLVTVANFDGYFTRVNPAAEQILGYTPEQLVTIPYLDIVHPDDRDNTTAEIAAIGEATTTLSFENRNVRKDGSHTVLEWTATAVPEERLIYAIARDVTERRKAEFEVVRLAEEQAALRRVATFVARVTPPDELFAAVTEEVGQLLQVDAAAMTRYEPNDAMTIVALWGIRSNEYEIGVTLPLGGRTLTTLVAQTRRPTRIDTHDDTSGGVRDHFDAAGLRSVVGAPIIVDGRLWGVISAGTYEEQPLPPDSEARLADFTELVATAIANAESRGELAASRVRIVNAADRTRRDIERDLHDGAQQHLIALSLALRLARATVPPELRELDGALSEVSDGLTVVQSELLEMARGIHPAILARGGLGPALKMLANRSPIVVELDVRANRRLPEPVEVASYYVVSEALTNAAKYAHASIVHVRVEVTEDHLRASVADDGVGGADATRGSGLVGLKDRVEALGGTITVDSHVGAGTSLRVELPLD